jgi:hypothetical protein
MANVICCLLFGANALTLRGVNVNVITITPFVRFVSDGAELCQKKGIQPKYSEDKLRRGIDEVKSHTMTVHKTSVIYRIQSRVHEMLLKNVKDEQLHFLKMLKTF